jgi:hypothetical protein
MNRHFSIGLFVTFAAVVRFGEERPGAARQKMTLRTLEFRKARDERARAERRLTVVD